MAIYGDARASTLEQDVTIQEEAPELVAGGNCARCVALVKRPMTIAESRQMTHSRHAQNPYLGFLFRCYSDPYVHLPGLTQPLPGLTQKIRRRCPAGQKSRRGWRG